MTTYWVVGRDNLAKKMSDEISGMLYADTL